MPSFTLPQPAVSHSDCTVKAGFRNSSFMSSPKFTVKKKYLRLGSTPLSCTAVIQK